MATTRTPGRKASRPGQKAAGKRTRREPAPHVSGTVAVVGRPNVGKSTLLNALIGEKIAIVSHHPQTTRDRILGVVTDEASQVAFLDTPGLHAPRNRLGVRMVHEAREALRGADVILFVTDVAPDPAGRVSERDRPVLAELPEGARVVCALNKIDRVRPKTKLMPVLEAYGAAREFAAMVPVSARTGDGVEQLLGAVRALLPEGPALYDPDTLTDRPVRFLVCELMREALLARTRQEVPFGLAVTVDRFEDATKKRPVTSIELTIHVPKEAHKKIVVGKGGAVLKEAGTAARKAVERLLEGKVHLKLWVRVTPGWFDQDGALRDIGYEPPPAEKKGAP